jgi:uncharacterized protein
MLIAILSDTHDNVANTKLAVEKAMAMGAEALFFCGDFCAPGAGRALAAFKGPLHFIFGNNDGDKWNIVTVVQKIRPDAIFYREDQALFEVDGLKVALTHYPLYGRALARTGDYDIVCFGHNHVASIETYGTCVAINPGCLNPVRAGSDEGFAMFNTATREAELIKL